MMRFLTKVRIFNSYNSLINQHLGNFSFSSHSKCNQNHFNPKKTQKNSPKNTNDSLFCDITGILVSENLNVGENLSGFSVSSENDAGFSGGGECTQGVRRNVVEKNEGDVSGIVGKITEVVRGYHGEVSMAELLDKLGFDEMSPDIVCKVLKRCFKVPYLGKRFFEWVKVKHASCVTTENYNAMLYMAGDVKDFELVERLLEEMEEYNCEKDVKTWTIILMHYGKAKLVGKALSTFEKMRRLSIEPDVEAYRILIQLLCKLKKGEIALEFYKEMVRKGFELESRVYPYLLNCLAGCGDVDGVNVVVNDMINVSQIPEHDAYSCALKSFCIAGRITEALGLIQDLNDKNVSLSPVFYETLVKGLCKAHRVDDALEIVEIMTKRNVVNEVVYGALVNGYLRKKDVSKALDLFYRMKEAGFKPLTSTYTELMQRHFHSNEYKKGCALYNELLETGVKLDTVAYTAMIAGHVRHGHISAAWKVFRSMENDGIRPTQKCFLIFVKELCRSSSEAKEIFKVLIYMLDSNFNIGNEVTDCVTCYFERKKDVVNLEHVKAIIRRVREYPEIGLSRDDSSVVNIQTREETSVESNVKCLSLEPLPQPYSDEDLRKLRDILSSDHYWFSMKEALEKLTICYTPALVSETLDVCGRHGSAALHFFSWVRNQPGYRHTTETYNSAIKIAGKGKDFKHMRYLFHEMQRNRCLVTPDTWTIMIMLYGRVGLTDIASRIFSEMKTSGCKPTTNVYKYLLLSFCGKKGRKVDEAIKLFSEMTSAGLVPDKELVEVCFDCFCQAGKLEEARKCLKRLQKVGFSTPLSYSLLIRALCRIGKLDDALTLANDVKEDRSTLDHYIGGSVVHGLLKKGRLDEALLRIKTMKEDGIRPTVHVYTSLISHFCKAKDIDRALDIFKTMYEEGCHPTVVTYTALIYGFINTDNFETAQKLFLRMRYKGPFPDFKTYSILISSLCERGESEAAFRFLSEMMNDGIVPSTINFRTVFFGLNREGKQHLSRKVMFMKHDVTSKRKFIT